MAHNYEFSFELKPGRFVYVPRADTAAAAKEIIRSVEQRYQPDRIFFHLRRHGGHVAALRLHRSNTYFTRFDIDNFFGRVTRTKIIRALRSVGFTPTEAFDIAYDSVVVENGKKLLPYGFRQSPLLATLVLERSLLGQRLKAARAKGFTTSAFVDDLLISSNDVGGLETVSNDIAIAAHESGFPLAAQKTALVVEEVESFNCRIQQNQLSILDTRMEKFADLYDATSEAGQAAIEKYIDAISAGELDRFKNEFLP